MILFYLHAQLHTARLIPAAHSCETTLNRLIEDSRLSLDCRDPLNGHVKSL